jgi:hypothetical protein
LMTCGYPVVRAERGGSDLATRGASCPASVVDPENR